MVKIHLSWFHGISLTVHILLSLTVYIMYECICCKYICFQFILLSSPKRNPRYYQRQQQHFPFFAESIQAFHLMYFLSVRSYFGVFFFFIHLSIPFVNCYQMRFIHTLCCCPSTSSAVSCVLLFPHSYLELPLTSPICVIFFD